MDGTPEFTEVLTLALKLSLKERLRLAERVTLSVEREIEAPPKSEEQPEHWGRALNKLLDSLDMSDWQALEMDDPVEWVERQREEERKQRLGDWGEDE